MLKAFQAHQEQKVGIDNTPVSFTNSRTRYKISTHFSTTVYVGTHFQNKDIGTFVLFA